LIKKKKKKKEESNEIHLWQLKCYPKNKICPNNKLVVSETTNHDQDMFYYITPSIKDNKIDLRDPWKLRWEDKKKKSDGREILFGVICDHTQRSKRVHTTWQGLY